MKYNNIVFDSFYLDELNDLIVEQKTECDILLLNEIDFLFENNIKILEILGVDLKKNLYNTLLDLDMEIEESYNILSDFDNYVGLSETNTKKLINNIKRLNLKRIVLIMDVNNLLSPMEYKDLIRYSRNISEETDDYEGLQFLLDDDYFDETTIMDDVFKKSLFTCNDLCYSTLRSKLMAQSDNEMENIKYSKIKFYLSFLELLEEEIAKENEISYVLTAIKYRLINVIDTMYDTFIFLNRDILSDVDFTQNYSFIEYDVKYFINELLMYDDSKYKNDDYNSENINVYTDNIIKALFIKTYYNLTHDITIVSMIKNNKLYGVNNISTSFISDIVEKYKKRIKGV